MTKVCYRACYYPLQMVVMIHHKHFVIHNQGLLLNLLPPITSGCYDSLQTLCYPLQVVVMTHYKYIVIDNKGLLLELLLLITNILLPITKVCYQACYYPITNGCYDSLHTFCYP